MLDAEARASQTVATISTPWRKDTAAAYPPKAKSLFLFAEHNPVRVLCVRVSTSKLFNNFMLFIIFCNCVTLALSSNRQGFEDTQMGKALTKMDAVYVAIFSLEMVLKVIAMGFVLDKGSYLRDGWNCLDFLVVVAAYLSLVAPSNLTGIRTIRTLRPLKTVNRIRGLKVLVTTLLHALPLLFDVFVLCTFTFFLFSLVAVQLFAGVLRYRCGNPLFDGAYNVTGPNGGLLLANVSYSVPEEQAEDTCSGPMSADATWYWPFPDGSPVALTAGGGQGRVCDSGLYCTLYGNPADGKISFDNILWAWLTVFQNVTMSGWADVMFWVMDAVNYWVWIFFIGVIIFGAFFMVNLALAVLVVNFKADNSNHNNSTNNNQRNDKRTAPKTGAQGGRQQGQEEEQQQQEQERGRREREQEGESGPETGPPTYTAALLREGVRVQHELRAEEERRAEAAAAAGGGGSPPPPPGLGWLRRTAWRVATSRKLAYTTAALIVVNTAVLCLNWYGMPYSVELATDISNYVLTIYFVAEMAAKVTGLGFKRYFSSGLNIFDCLVALGSLAEMIVDLIPSVSGGAPLSVLRAFRLLRLFSLARIWGALAALLRTMGRSVVSSMLLVGVMALFVFVSALVGMQLFGYKFMFCGYVDGAAAVCPPGQEVWGQCPNHFYCYLPCTADQYDTWIDAPGSFYNDLAYCQRFCPSASTVTTVDAGGNTTAPPTPPAGEPGAAGAGAGAVAAGDGGGGCEYLAMVGKSAVPRANFDNVFWAMFTVFQVLTGENWNDVMFDSMRAVSDWSSLYFILVIVIGNYLVFNLFIAILLDNLNPSLQGKPEGGDDEAEDDEEETEDEAEEKEREKKEGSKGKAPKDASAGSALVAIFSLPPTLPLPPLQDGPLSTTVGASGDPSGSPPGAAPQSGGPQGRPPPSMLRPQSTGFPCGMGGAVVFPDPDRPVGPSSGGSSRSSRNRAWPLGGGTANGVAGGGGGSGGGGYGGEEAGMGAGGLPDSGASRLQESLPPLGPGAGGPGGLSAEGPGARMGRGEGGASRLGGGSGGGGPASRYLPTEGPYGRLPPLLQPRAGSSAASPDPGMVGAGGGGAGGSSSADAAAAGGVMPPAARGPAVGLALARLSAAGRPPLPPLGGPGGRGGGRGAGGPVGESLELQLGEALGSGGLARVQPSQSAVEQKQQQREEVGKRAEEEEGSRRGHSAIGSEQQEQQQGGHGEELHPPPPPPPPMSSPDRAQQGQRTQQPGQPGLSAGAPTLASDKTRAPTALWKPGAGLRGKALPELLTPPVRQSSPSPPPSLPLPAQQQSLALPASPQQPLTQLQSQPQPAAVALGRPAAAPSLETGADPEACPETTPEAEATAAAAPSPDTDTDGPVSSSSVATTPAAMPALSGRSLWLLPPHHPLRRGVARLVFHPRFDDAVLLIILAACVCLVLDSPSLDPSSTLARTLRYLDYAFTAVFTVEALLKIVALGFVLNGPGSYLRDGWNALDFGIVLLGWALIVVELVGQDSEGVKALRVLRALRALRPLRAVRRFEGLRVVVHTLFAVVPAMLQVALVCSFFFLIFSILSVNFFKGQLFNCIDAASGERLDPFYIMPPGQEMTRQWCEAGSVTVGGVTSYFVGTNVTMPPYELYTKWVNPIANFDNVGIAMLTLFQVASLSLWVDITFTAVDAAGVDRQPLWNNHPIVVLYFIVFILVCSFFVLNLFVGVTLDKFAEMHEQRYASTVRLTSRQQQWASIQRLLLRTEPHYRPPRPKDESGLRRTLYEVLTSRDFEAAMMGVIAANVVVMAMVHVDMSGGWQAAMSWSNVAFTAVFVVEAVLKIATFGLRGYFRDGWSCFDFFVSLVSLASVALDFSNVSNVTFIQAMKAARVVRVVRLIRHAKGMKKLISTLVTSLPAVVNVGGVMVVLFFVFAVVGVNLFYGVKEGGTLSDHINFDNLPNAVMTLFWMLTGEGWNGIMQDCMNNSDCVLVTTTVTVTPTPHSSAPPTLPAGTYLDPSSPLLPLLPPGSTDDQCPLNPVAAVLYFPTFVILCTFILLQLVIAVLLENLLEATEDDELPLSRSCLDSFVAAWAEADSDATGLLPACELPSVLLFTEPPLGVGLLHNDLHLHHQHHQDQHHNRRNDHPYHSRQTGRPKTSGGSNNNKQEQDDWTLAGATAAVAASATSAVEAAAAAAAAGGGRTAAPPLAASTPDFSAVPPPQQQQQSQPLGDSSAAGPEPGPGKVAGRLAGGSGGLGRSAQPGGPGAGGIPGSGRGSGKSRSRRMQLVVQVHARLLGLRIPLYEGNQVSFVEVLQALVQPLWGVPLPPGEEEKLASRASRVPRGAKRHDKYLAAHFYAANSVHAAIRAFLLRHRYGNQLYDCRTDFNNHPNPYASQPNHLNHLHRSLVVDATAVEPLGRSSTTTLASPAAAAPGEDPVPSKSATPAAPVPPVNGTTAPASTLPAAPTRPSSPSPVPAPGPGPGPGPLPGPPLHPHPLLPGPPASGDPEVRSPGGLVPGRDLYFRGGEGTGQGERKAAGSGDLG